MGEVRPRSCRAAWGESGHLPGCGFPELMCREPAPTPACGRPSRDRKAGTPSAQPARNPRGGEEPDTDARAQCVRGKLTLSDPRLPPSLSTWPPDQKPGILPASSSPPSFHHLFTPLPPPSRRAPSSWGDQRTHTNKYRSQMTLESTGAVDKIKPGNGIERWGWGGWPTETHMRAGSPVAKGPTSPGAFTAEISPLPGRLPGCCWCSGLWLYSHRGLHRPAHPARTLKLHPWVFSGTPGGGSDGRRDTNGGDRRTRLTRVFKPQLHLYVLTWP